jgi:hypothetical protein
MRANRIRKSLVELTKSEDPVTADLAGKAEYQVGRLQNRTAALAEQAEPKLAKTRERTAAAGHVAGSVGRAVGHTTADKAKGVGRFTKRIPGAVKGAWDEAKAVADELEA